MILIIRLFNLSESKQIISMKQKCKRSLSHSDVRLVWDGERWLKATAQFRKLKEIGKKL